MTVAHALLRAVSALVPARWATAKRRDESRRGTQSALRHSGQATVEFALLYASVVLPLTFMIVFVSEMLWVWHSVADFTRDGARYAATHCWMADGSNVAGAGGYMPTHVPAMIDMDQFQTGAAGIQVQYFSDRSGQRRSDAVHVRVRRLQRRLRARRGECEHYQLPVQALLRGFSNCPRSPSRPSPPTCPWKARAATNRELPAMRTKCMAGRARPLQRRRGEGPRGYPLAGGLVPNTALMVASSDEHFREMVRDNISTSPTPRWPRNTRRLAPTLHPGLAGPGAEPQRRPHRRYLRGPRRGHQGHREGQAGVPDLFVIASHFHADGETVIACMRAGANEFLLQPIKRTDFRDAISRLERAPATPSRARASSAASTPSLEPRAESAPPPSP